jgi:hypothetical protein
MLNGYTRKLVGRSDPARAISWNVRSINTNTHMKMDFIKQAKPEIAFVH